MTSPEQGRGPDGDGWIAWEGGDCPEPPEAITQSRLRNGGGPTGWKWPAHMWRWEWTGAPDDIIAYRVVQPIPPSPAAVKHVERGEEAKTIDDPRVPEYIILANARRICSRRFKKIPNWSLAMEIFGLGSTWAWALCKRAGVDPDSTSTARTVTRTGDR